MKKQFILNPSYEKVEETAKEFCTKDALIAIDYDDVHLVMDGVDNALFMTSEASEEGRIEKIISDFKSSENEDGYNFNTADSLLICIEYPKDAEATIDETSKLLDALAEKNSKIGIIWGARVIEGNSMKVKVIATNLKRD